MPQRWIQNVPGFQGVANSGNGVLVLPPALRYHDINVFTTIAGVLANPVLAASNLKLKVGGLTIRDMSPDQAIRLAKLYKITPVVGQIPLFFTEPWLADPRTRELFSWDMNSQQKLTLEITFLNPVGGAVGILNTFAVVDTVRNGAPNQSGQVVPFLQIVKMKNETFNFSGAARLGNTTLDKSLPIRALLVDSSTGGGSLTDVEVIADSFSLFNQIPTGMLGAIYNNMGNIDISQFALPLVFDFDGLARSKLTAAALEVKITSTGALVTTILNCQEAKAFV